MEKKPVDLPALFKDGGKAAGGGVLLSLLLLLPLTVMVRAGILPMAAVPACVWLTAGVSAFLAQRLLTTEKGRGAVPALWLRKWSSRCFFWYWPPAYQERRCLSEASCLCWVLLWQVTWRPVSSEITKSIRGPNTPKGGITGSNQSKSLHNDFLITNILCNLQ